MSQICWDVDPFDEASAVGGEVPDVISLIILH
jgi:hypothetical protein